MSSPRSAFDTATLKIGFIGAGRLACALARALEAHGCPVYAAASRQPSAARALADKTAACRVFGAQQVADTCDLVFVTTPDSVIETVVGQLTWQAGMGVVHCSGATEVAVLAKAAADGASIGGFHPMQTFADPEVAARTLPGCVVTIEAEGALNDLLRAVATRLGCPVNQLPPGNRGAYHAAAGYASQYVNVLLAEAVAIWKSWGASEADALRALVPLARGTLSSIESAGVAKGMPGPVSRGDAHTVARHVEALSAIDSANPSLASLYKALCLRSISLAQEAGNISAAKAEEIRGVLDGRPHDRP